jgi:hypothetical protein
MGGKALKSTYTERKSTIQYNEITDKILKLFQDDVNYDTHLVKAYHNKKTHGDADILIKSSGNCKEEVIEFIENRIRPNEIVENGNVISFDYFQFQIDFIFVPCSYWETAQSYYDYDATGNIMGKTYHKFNLSYGWEGLKYKYRNYKGTNSSDIVISTDIRKIFEFGGYDYDRYLRGFETLEEIYEFCIKSKFFDVDIFQMENLGRIDRKRNKKRPSYHAFLKYLEDNCIDTKYELFHVGIDKKSYLPVIDAYFPEADLVNKLRELDAKDSEDKVIATKFNGDMVMTWLPDLIGKKLGAAIGDFKGSFIDGTEYRNFILTSDFNTIKNAFMVSYEEE